MQGNNSNAASPKKKKTNYYWGANTWFQELAQHSEIPSHVDGQDKI